MFAPFTSCLVHRDAARLVAVRKPRGAEEQIAALELRRWLSNIRHDQMRFDLALCRFKARDLAMYLRLSLRGLPPMDRYGPRFNPHVLIAEIGETAEDYRLYAWTAAHHEAAQERYESNRQGDMRERVNARRRELAAARRAARDQ